MVERSFPDITSERFILRWMSPEFMQASLDGRIDKAVHAIGATLPAWWPDDWARLRLTMRLAQMNSDPVSAQWLLRAMLRRSDGSFVGVINFHDAPDDRRRAELGYTVFEAHRRQGYATEAARAMMAWAATEHGVRTFLLSISPGNEPSLRVAARLGFVQVGSQIDEEDGEEWVFELPWTDA